MMLQHESEEKKLLLPLLSFQVITDTHLTPNSSHAYNVNFERALQDIYAQAPASHAIMHVGDITEHGYNEEYRELMRIMNKYHAYLPNIHYTLGNHDVGVGDFHVSLKQFLSYTHSPAPYYDLWLKGYHFLFLGTEEGLESFCTLSDTQLHWLEEKLQEQGDNDQHSDRYTFIFLHQPLINTVAGSSEDQSFYGVQEDEQLREILRKYPNLILFTGHTHWEMEAKNTIYYDPISPRGPVMLNVASTAYLWNDEHEPIVGSQGYYVEVYEDQIKIRGRDFLRRKWIASAHFTIEIARDEQCDSSAS